MDKHSVKVFICCCYTLLITSVVLAQQTNTEKREMLFRISSLRKVKADSLVAVIKGGSKQGITIGSTGPVSGTYEKGKDRTNLELGFAAVQRVDSNLSLVIIRPKDSSAVNKNAQILKGDYIKLPIKINKLPYHSIFFDLALLDIDFKNLDNKELYKFNDLLAFDSKKAEDSLLLACAKDVFDTYTFFKDDTSGAFKSLREKNLIGRYDKKSPFDVMSQCTPRDVFAFLNFVKSYPGKYIGNSWKINETFATWVINNAPYSKIEFLDSLRLYKNNVAALRQFIAKNKALMIKDEFVRGWLSDAVDNYNLSDFKNSDELIGIAKLVLPYLNDDRSTGFYYYVTAQLQQDKRNYTRAIGLCDTGIIYFEKCKDFEFYTECFFKKAYCYKQLKNYDAAITVYSLLKPIMTTNNWPTDDKIKTNQTAKYYRDFANAHESKTEYPKAIEYYQLSIELYKNIKTYNSLLLAAENELRLAKIYAKQGEYVKASNIYNQQLKTYRQLNDSKNEADVLDNLGYIESKIGNYRIAIAHYQRARQLHVFYKEYSEAGFSESSIAQCLWSLGQLDSAIIGHKTALVFRKTANNNTGQGYSWSKLGALYGKVGKKDQALISYDSAAHYYSLAKDSSSLITNLLNIGEVYENDKQYRKAFDYYIKVKDIYEKQSRINDMIDGYMKLGSASYKFDTSLSRNYYEKALVNARKIGDKSNELYSLLNLGLLKNRNYDLVGGQQLFNNALKITIEQKNKSEEAYCYNYIGQASYNQLDYDRALVSYSKAVKIYDSLNEKSSLPPIYGSMGYCYQSKGDFVQSMQYLKKQQALAVEIKNSAEEASALGSLSFQYVITGDLKLSGDAADSCLAIYKRLNNNWQLGNAYITKGNVENKLAAYANAVQYYSLADSLFQAEKDDLGRSTAQNNIGNVYFFQANYDKALDYFFESEIFLAKLKYANESALLAKLNIGEVYYHKKDYKKAETYLMQGYTLAKERKAGRMLTSANLLLGKLYFDLKDYAKSETYLLQSFESSLKTNETGNLTEGSLFLSRLYNAKNDAIKARQYLNTSIAIAEKSNNTEYYWEALYEMGMQFYAIDKFDSAVFYMKKGVEIVEKRAQNLFGGAEAKKIYSADYRKVDLYNKLVASLVKINNKEEALYYADKSNNQAIKEQTEKAGFATNDKEKSTAVQQSNELLQKQNAVEEAIEKEKAKPVDKQSKELIASLESIRQIAQKDYINYINGLVKKYPDLQSYFSKTNPADFKNNMRYIPDSTLAVLYIINDNQLYIFTGTKKEISIKTIELKTDINKQADRFLNILRNPENVTGTAALRLRASVKRKDGIKGDFKAEAALLYDLLITPIQDQLKDKKNICIIPNGKLSNIPLQAIGKIVNNEFRFLVEDYAVFYTNKIDIFSKPFEKVAIAESFMALGNPDKTLPSAAEEVRGLSKIVRNAAVYTEGDATEAKATDALSNFSYVHFATHGVLDFADFEKSYLVFAPEQSTNSDGRLTIEKINGLTITNCSMVTLSACETAVSKESVKGWYISPANSFLQNNVSTVVASLWQVDDKATSILMEAFYRNLTTMSKTEALRKAQALLSKNPEYAHPYFWSAFVLYGDWR